MWSSLMRSSDIKSKATEMSLLFKELRKALMEQKEWGGLLAPWTDTLDSLSLYLHQYSQVFSWVHRKTTLPDSLAVILGHVTDFCPMTWRKKCITLKGSCLNIINFSFILGSGCSPNLKDPGLLQNCKKLTVIQLGRERNFHYTKPKICNCPGQLEIILI